MRIRLKLVCFLFPFALVPVLVSNAGVISSSSLVNPGFEAVGSDPGDGLRTTPPWTFSSIRAARAFPGRDGINTGLGGYMRLITEGSDRGETMQDFEGTTILDTIYSFGATALNTPNTDPNLADYEVAMSLLEVGRSATVGGPIANHVAPILLDTDTVMISALGGMAPLSVTFMDDGTGLDLRLRIHFESAAALATGTFTRGGVDDVTLTTTAVPEPNSFALLGIATIGLAVYGWRCRKRKQAA